MFLVHKKIKEKDRRRLSLRLNHYHYFTREYQRERRDISSIFFITLSDHHFPIYNSYTLYYCTNASSV